MKKSQKKALDNFPKRKQLSTAEHSISLEYALSM